jgi:hypothetical protein
MAAELRQRGGTVRQDEYDEALALGDAVIAGYRLWLAEQSPQQAKVLYVEQKWNVTTRSGTPVSGAFDLVWEDPLGSVWITDYKTAKQLPNPVVLQLSKQAAVYLWAGRALWGDRLKGLIFDHLRKQAPGPRVRTPLYGRTVVPLNEADLPHVEAMLDRSWARVQRLSRSSVEETEYEPGLHCGWRCCFQDVCLAARHAGGNVLESMMASRYVIRPQRPGELGEGE